MENIDTPDFLDTPVTRQIIDNLSKKIELSDDSLLDADLSPSLFNNIELSDEQGGGKRRKRRGASKSKKSKARRSSRKGSKKGSRKSSKKGSRKSSKKGSRKGSKKSSRKTGMRRGVFAYFVNEYRKKNGIKLLKDAIIEVKKKGLWEQHKKQMNK